MLGEPATCPRLLPRTFDPPKASLVLSLIVLPMLTAIQSIKSLVACLHRT